MYTILVIRTAVLTESAKRDLRKVPGHVARKLLVWVDAVEQDGLEEVRKVPGYHDEPLKGTRRGQRSIRLSLAYRAIYVVKRDGGIEIASVEEVNRHDY